jgi:hypothetical protein
MSKFVGTRRSSYKKRIYRTAVSQRLRTIGVKDPAEGQTSNGFWQRIKGEEDSR